MIRVRPLSPETCDAAYLAPFLQRHGRISEHQVPALATILAEDARPIGYEFIRDGKPIGYAVVKIRHHILADISFGPIVLDNDQFTSCVAALKPALRRKGALLLRIIPPYGAPQCKGLPANFNWATSVVDLSPAEEDILKSFSPNHRQSIRKAVAAGIRVRPLDAENVDAYARGHVGMFARRGISKDAAATLKLITELHALAKDPAHSVFILSAFSADSDQIIGGGVFLCTGDTCTYYQGYAERLEPPLPVLHLVLWEAMKRAKAMGCSRFDLSGYSLDDDDQQLKAVNDFKRWFRGAIIHNPPTVVIPLYPLIATLLRISGKRI